MHPKHLGIMTIFSIASLIVLTIVLAGCVNSQSQEVIVEVTRLVVATPTPTTIPGKETPSVSTPAETTWTSYESQDLEFSAYVPSGWEPGEFSELGYPYRGIIFSSSDNAIQIAVSSAPMPQGSGPHSTTELKQLANTWVKPPLEEVVPPTETNLHGYSAVWLVFEAKSPDDEAPIRGHTILISTSKWLYIIQVVGLANDEVELQETYDRFTSSFRPNSQ